MKMIQLDQVDSETIEEFIERGGKILYAPDRHAVGAPSPSKIKVKGGQGKGYQKHAYRMGYKISSVYNR